MDHITSLSIDALENVASSEERGEPGMFLEGGGRRKEAVA